jgi:hypothetical protein
MPAIGHELGQQEGESERLHYWTHAERPIMAQGRTVSQDASSVSDVKVKVNDMPNCADSSSR